ncbi:succinylglutamate desuccinylase [Pseudoalteromonas denitrificans]|uniref:Succinylglutamate desuccinylase n=1 Tax=Pseudoalteromonas denitrificans DSM 6059 TaxID=1123010 RepID=A0A1I1M1Y1_9GAMM|nr:succinylglutamate desuccinylase [Pseudoalteromonas denitrificans]SFC79527.1 succinylglutamate desuccinylase [Pseudoalteromonas denitrificans DSM 6059]
MYIETLKKTGDFLSISRKNEWSLNPCSFELSNGTLVEVLDTGVIQFTPKTATQKDIVLSSAVHGNETAPIEICDELIQNIITQKITLKQRALFIFGNPASINIGKRFVTENLNRLFSGEHSKGEGLVNLERKHAKKLEQYVTQFFTSQETGRYRCHYDLHTAIRGSKNEKFAVYPYLNGKPWKKHQLNFLLACGVNTVLMMKSAATTFSYFASNELGADAFTIELGQVRPFGENNMASFDKVKNTLTALLTLEELVLPEYKSENFELFEVYRAINRTKEDFSFSFSDDVENFTGFEKGALMATDGDKHYVAEVDGEAIIFPNAQVALGQRALLTVIPLLSKNIV